MKRQRTKTVTTRNVTLTQENSIIEPTNQDASYDNPINLTNTRMVTQDLIKTKDVDLSNMNEEISKYHDTVIKTNDVIFKQSQISKSLDKGSLYLAKTHYYETYGICNKNIQSLPVCVTDTQYFYSYGEGLGLYFQFMKGLAIIFGICALISGFLMYVNYRGAYLNERTMVTYLDYVALSNTFGFKNATTDKRAANWPSDNNMWYLLYYYFDFGESIYLILILIVFKFYLNREGKKVVKSRVHPQKFTIEVSGFTQDKLQGPPTEQDLITHFSKFGSVKHVSCIRNYDGLFYYFSQADKIYQKIQLQKARDSFQGSKDSSIQQMTQEYMQTLKNGDNKNKLKLRNEQFPIIAAFITFDSVNDKKTTMRVYSKYRFWNCKGKTPKELKFKDKYEIKQAFPFFNQICRVRDAPDPSVINWTNYTEKLWLETLTNVGIWVLLIMSLFFTYLVCFALREYILASIYNPTCKSTIYLNKSESSYTNATEKGYVKECFCSQYSSFQLLYGDYTQYKGYCYQYINYIQHYIYVVVGFGGFILVSNIVNILIIHFFYKLRTFKDKTQEAKSKLTSVFLINFVNTWLPLIIIHIDLRWCKWVQYLHDNMYYVLNGGRNFNTLLFYGQYPDTTRGWIQWINLPICSIIGVQFVFSLLIPLLAVAIYKLDQQCRLKKKVLQIEYNRLYKGLSFFMEYKYAIHAQFVSTILLFSGAIPCLVCLIPFYFLIHFWTDKILMLRIYRVPPRIDRSINERALDLLFIGVLLHVAATLWIFSYPLFFPSSIKIITQDKINYYYVASISFFDRIFTKNGIQYFVVLCFGVLLFFFLQAIAFRAVQICCFKKSKRKEANLRIFSFTQEFINFDKRGKHNTIEYDMMHNPKYRRALDLMNCNHTNDIELQDLNTLRMHGSTEKFIMTTTNKVSPEKKQ